MLSLFYMVNPNISAIRQLDSLTPTQIQIKQNYQQKEVIYFTIEQMGRLT